MKKESESTWNVRLFKGSAMLAPKSDCKVIDFTRHTNGRVLNGRAMSLGTATGRAMVIRETNDIYRVKDGAIVISKNASPDLVLAMSKAGAIVTEYGSQSACALGFAREYGIPAVAGISDITERIGDGDIIEVNGTKGTIEIIKYNTLQQDKGKYRHAS